MSKENAPKQSSTPSPEVSSPPGSDRQEEAGPSLPEPGIMRPTSVLIDSKEPSEGAVVEGKYDRGRVGKKK